MLLGRLPYRPGGPCYLVHHFFLFYRKIRHKPIAGGRGKLEFSSAATNCIEHHVVPVDVAGVVIL